MTETFQLHEQQALMEPGIKGRWQRISLWLSGFREAQIFSRVIVPDAKTCSAQIFYFMKIPSIVPFKAASYEWDLLRDEKGHIVKIPNTDLSRKLESLDKLMPNGSWVVLE